MTLRRWIVTAVAHCLLLLRPALAMAAHTGQVQTAASPRVSVVFFAPSSPLWANFGHVGLWLQDAQSGVDIFTHWGLYDFSAEGFWLDFLQGRMEYGMSSTTRGSRVLKAYESVGRPFSAVDLAVTQEEFSRLLNHITQQPPTYRYDYLRDNCATRVRDALWVMWGDNKRFGASVRSTFRVELGAVLSGRPLSNVLIDLFLGPVGDESGMTVWTRSFLPSTLEDALRAPVDADTSRTLYILGRYRTAALLASIGAFLFMTGLASTTSVPLVRKAAGAIVVTWCATAAGVGILLTYFWIITDHYAIHRNWNIGYFGPWAVAPVALVLLRPRHGYVRRLLLNVPTFACLLIALLSGVGVNPQANLQFALIAIPGHIAARYWAIARLARGGGADHAKRLLE